MHTVLPTVGVYHNKGPKWGERHEETTVRRVVWLLLCDAALLHRKREAVVLLCSVSLPLWVCVCVWCHTVLWVCAVLCASSPDAACASALLCQHIAPRYDRAVLCVRDRVTTPCRARPSADYCERVWGGVPCARHHP